MKQVVNDLQGKNEKVAPADGAATERGPVNWPRARISSQDEKE